MQLTTLQPADLAASLKDLLLKLQLARGVDTTPERYAYFLAQLTEDGYTLPQLQTAKLWILKGNWQYKGAKPLLELADFYPTPKQIEPLTAGCLVLTHADLQERAKEAYQRGKQAAANEFINKDKDTAAYVDLVAFAKEYTAKLADLRQQNEELSYELRHTRRELGYLQAKGSL